MADGKGQSPGSGGRVGAVPALVAMLFVCVCACASRPGPPTIALSPAEWEQELRARNVDRSIVPNPLRATRAMREEAARLAGLGSPEERLLSLKRGLFDPTWFPFEYDSRETYTAAEAFEHRRGNCLSSTNLFIAMARSIGIPVRAALIDRPGDSEKEGHLVVVNTHVVAFYAVAERTRLFDFYRDRRGPQPDLRPIDDLWVAALYANNLGVEDLRAGRLESARRRIEAAARLAPDFVDALSNLGVVRRHVGDTRGALEAHQRALDLAPGHSGVLHNLAALYEGTGQQSEARAALEASGMDAGSPFLLLVRGELEMNRGDPGAALRFFRRARRMDRTLAEPLVAIARAEIALGRKRAARRALSRALELDPDREDAGALMATLGS